VGDLGGVEEAGGFLRGDDVEGHGVGDAGDEVADGLRIFPSWCALRRVSTRRIPIALIVRLLGLIPGNVEGSYISFALFGMWAESGMGDLTKIVGAKEKPILRFAQDDKH